MATEIATAYVSLVPSFRGGSRAITQSLAGPISQAGPEAGRSLGRSILRGVGAAAAVGGGIVAALGIKNLGRAAFQAASDLQNTEATLSGLLGSADAAADTMSRLREVARTSPIQLQTYLDAGESLAYMGFQGEKAEDILRNVGAAITAAGGDDQAMGRATDAMLQMVNSGRVYAAQLNQISDAGVPVFSSLAEHFGTNIENVREMVSAGEVGIEDVMSAIQNAEGDTFQSMLDASDNASKTMSNQWEIAKDNIVQALGEQLLPVVEALTPVMQEFAKRAPGIISGIASGISSAMSVVLPLLSRFAEFISNTVWPVLQDIGRFIVSNFVPAVLDLGGAIVDAVLPPMQQFGEFVQSTVLPAVRDFAETIGAGIIDALSGLADWIRENSTLVGTLAAALGGAVLAMKIYQASILVIQGVTKAWAAVQRVLNTVLRANPIGIVITIIGALVAALIYAWNNSETFRDVVTGVWEAIRNGVTTAWDWIKRQVIDRLIAAWGWVQDATGVLRQVVVDAWENVREGLSAAWRWLKTNVIDRIVAGFRWVWERAVAMKDGAVSAWRTMRDALRAAWEWIRDRVINPVRDGFKWVWDRAVEVKDGVVSAWRTMRDILRGVWEWIRDKVFSPVRSGFQNVWDKAVEVKDGVVEAFSTVAETIEGAFNGITDGIKTALNWVFGKINDWMIGPINNLLGAVGISGIPELPKLHSGGIVPGQGEKPYMLLGGEAVLNPDAAKALGKENVEALNRGEPIGGFGLPDWVTEVLKHGAMIGTEYATGQRLSEGLLEGLRTVGNAGIEKLENLLAFAGIARDYSVGGTKKFFNGLIDWAIEGDKELREDAAKRFHGPLPKDGGGPGAGSNAGLVLPPGSYRIGRGPGAHGYNARDLPAPIGTPVYAAAAGMVSRALRLTKSYGIHAVIDHGGWRSLYAHMSQMYVRAGQQVARGQMIGRVGSTGNSTGPHLHLEPDAARLYDKGGYLPPGHSLVYNGTGREERVLDPKETAAYERYGSNVHINMYGPLEEQALLLERKLQRRQLMKRRP